MAKPADNKQVPNPKKSRRNFLLAAGAGVVTTSVAGPAALAETGSVAGGDWTYVTDVVCVGSGAAAMTAAVTARNQGAEVMVLEKMPILGGTTGNRSGGVAWIPNNHLLREKGIEDKREDCLKYMARYSYPQIYDPKSPTLGLPESRYRLIEAFYDNGSRMIDYIESTGVLQYKQVTTYAPDKLSADYAGHLPEDKVPQGRSIDPKINAGGMEAQSILEYARRGGGGFVHATQTWLQDHQVPILIEHRVTKIIKEGNRVIGVEAQGGDKTVRIKARRAVIFGTGGYAHNTELVSLHQTALYGSCAAPGATGDIIALAADAGARMGTLNIAWRSQVLLEDALKNRAQGWTIFFLPGDSMIVVNKYGHRVGNEKRSYNDRPKVHFTYDPTREEYPNQLLFQIFDERSLDAFGGDYPIPRDRRETRSLIEGATLDELADNIAKHLASIADKTGGVALADDFKARLKGSVQRFNGFAKAGKDPDFDRGLHDYDREFHRTMSPMRPGTKQAPNKLPNVTMYPMSKKGPYFAFILGAGALDTCGGPLINESAQLIGNDNQPIPGLYGAGNCISSPTNGAYYGAGGTIGPAMTFGYIAAMHATKGQANG